MGKNDETVGAFGKLLGLIKKYGWGNILKTTIFLVFVTIFVLFIMNFQTFMTEALTNYNEKSENEKIEHHDEAMKKRKEIKPLIESLMKDVIIDLDVDRVFILEMHNGTNNTSGLPFLYAELTYSKSNGTVENVDDEYEKLNLSRYDFPYFLLNNELYVGTVDSLMLIDPKIANKLKINGDTYIAITIIHGTKNDIGYMGFTFSKPLEKCNINKNLFYKRLTMDAQKISSLLDMQPLYELYKKKILFE